MLLAALVVTVGDMQTDDFLALADRAVFLEKGSVRFRGTAQELTEQGDLAAAIAGEAWQLGYDRLHGVRIVF